MTPTISIIIPCYNQQEFIDRCVASVIEQTFTTWECILINDGSTDRTAEIGQKWTEKDSRVKLFNKTNGGLSSARNSGMEKANGTHILFLDSDDRLADKNSLFHLAKSIQHETEVVAGNIYNEFADGSLKKSTLNKVNPEVTIFKKEEVLTAYLEEKISPVAWNKIYKTTFIKDHCLKFEEGLLHEDELWSLQVYLNAENVVTIPEFTYKYYKDNLSSITENKNEKNYNSYIFIMKKITEYAADHPKLKKTLEKLVIRLFEKQYYFLKSDAVIDNKKLWIKNYGEIRSIYRNSILNSYQKRFLYPAFIAYYALKINNSETALPILKKLSQKAITY